MQEEYWKYQEYKKLEKDGEIQRLEDEIVAIEEEIRLQKEAFDAMVE